MQCTMSHIKILFSVVSMGKAESDNKIVILAAGAIAIVLAVVAIIIVVVILHVTMK